MSTTSSLHSPANTHIPVNLNDPSQLTTKHFTPNNYNAILKSINNNLMANNIIPNNNNNINNNINNVKPINKTFLYLNNPASPTKQIDSKNKISILTPLKSESKANLVINIVNNKNNNKTGDLLVNNNNIANNTSDFVNGAKNLLNKSLSKINGDIDDALSNIVDSLNNNQQNISKNDSTNNNNLVSKSSAAFKSSSSGNLLKSSSNSRIPPDSLPVPLTAVSTNDLQTTQQLSNSNGALNATNRTVVNQQPITTQHPAGKSVIKSTLISSSTAAIHITTPIMINNLLSVPEVNYDFDLFSKSKSNNNYNNENSISSGSNKNSSHLIADHNKQLSSSSATLNKPVVNNNNNNNNSVSVSNLALNVQQTVSVPNQEQPNTPPPLIPPTTQPASVNNPPLYHHPTVKNLKGNNLISSVSTNHIPSASNKNQIKGSLGDLSKLYIGTLNNGTLANLKLASIVINNPIKENNNNNNNSTTNQFHKINQFDSNNNKNELSSLSTANVLAQPSVVIRQQIVKTPPASINKQQQQQQQQQQPKFCVKFAVNGLSKTAYGGSTPPINRNIQKGDYGDDSGMIAENSKSIVIGLADGAGGNRALGIDPKIFSRSLLSNCVEIIKNEELLPHNSYFRSKKY